MMIKNNVFSTKNDTYSWITIPEAINIAVQIKNKKLTKADIYRHALYGNINLSMYFQSPVILRKIRISKSKIKLKSLNHHLMNQLCTLDKNCFLNKRSLIVSTEGKFIHHTRGVIDTTLIGHEYILVQRLLATSLGIPLPAVSENHINYGLSVSIDETVFQVFEKVTYNERVSKQLRVLPENILSYISEQDLYPRKSKHTQPEYFPVHDLPQDACFVIRQAELEKLILMPVRNDMSLPPSTRISTPLARLFWLACKKNEAIRPLIRQPYKLLSIFEQWASDEGITDRLSGDTLKSALERGSPQSAQANKS